MTAHFETVIGMEVHARLKTASKMFCSCPNVYGAQPNTSTCPVCAGLPGALPLPNGKAIELGVKAALALGCDIDMGARFDRKQYFYPDLPKNYQITQLLRPLGRRGSFDVGSNGERKRIRISRLHVEEDSGKSFHDIEGDTTFLDLNRAGSPLIEIVTEPDFESTAQVGAFLRDIRSLLRSIDVSDGDMEKGSMRCEPNISLRPRGSATLGVRTEIKNLNSFGAVERALLHEVSRQTELLRAGGRVRAETLLWDRRAGVTHPMRGKEDIHDYRTFPEPDLGPLRLPEEWIEGLREALPELPRERAERFEREWSLPQPDANFLARDMGLADYFEACVAVSGDPRRTSRFLLQDVRALLRERRTDIDGLGVPPGQIARLLALLAEGSMNPLQARECLRIVAETGADVDRIREEKGLEQIRDEGKLVEVVRHVLARHPRSVREFRQGRERRALGYLMGRIVASTKGRADPTRARSVLERALRRLARLPDSTEPGKDEVEGGGE
ncbi:MAG: Asp-tRNA(Asn)/Glu-tRNA(Gln) amidotransferase subunit GatB [Planctomycetota bacterium]|jgi:aspartyl-tRNA(Asn)/glutamyl-tRNA(Gln) amidotransferase subunit B